MSRNPSDTGGRPAQAAPGPVPAPVSAAANPAARPDSPAEALGRRTLSTAFVRAGPDGLVTVDLRDGRSVVLRAVTMNRTGYCGRHAGGGLAGKRHCGGYAEVGAARPGGAGRPVAVDPASGVPAPRGR